MMLFRQRTLIIASLALLALSANTGVMVTADEAVDKDDKEDKDDEESEDMTEDEKEELAENLEEFIGDVLDAIVDADESELPSSEDGNSTGTFAPSLLMTTEEDLAAVVTDMGNLTAVVADMECACEGDIISCSDPADEEACECEDGETVCADIAVVESMDPPSTENKAKATQADIDAEMMADAGLDFSSAYTTSPMVSMAAISAAGIVAVALN